jgi:hypothetical protein
VQCSAESRRPLWHGAWNDELTIGRFQRLWPHNFRNNSGLPCRYGLRQAQPSAGSAAIPPEGGDGAVNPSDGPISPGPDPAAAEEIRQAVMLNAPPGKRHLSAAARRAARKQAWQQRDG